MRGSIGSSRKITSGNEIRSAFDTKGPMMKRTLLSLLTLSLAGCGATSDLPSDYALDPNAEQGLVVASLTLSGKDLAKVSSFEYRVRPAARKDDEAVSATPHFSSPTKHARWAQEEVRHDDADWRAVVKESSSAAALDVRDAGVVGRVAALRLPPGEYEFYTWKVVESSRYGTTELGPKQPFSYRFTVSPSQATYIGHLNLHLSERDTQEVTVEDRSERDLVVMRAKIPSMKATAVRLEVGRILP